MSSLASQSYVFDPRPNFPLLLTAKRYWAPSSPYLDDPEAFTLIFGHATGFHKEHYEPTLEELYNLIPGGPKIRECWSIDCPNHGDAAVLNEDTLRRGYEPIFGWQEYARGLHAFLSGLGTGVDVDFSTRRLILIGHSMSAVAFVFGLTYQPELKPHCLILLEVMCLQVEAVPKIMKIFTDASPTRRDIWPSLEDAYKSLKVRPTLRTWDDRVLRLHVKHGLTPLPTLEYPDKEGVTLKCTRKQETATYRDTLASFVVYRLMSSVIRRVSTHLVYGAIDDIIPRDVQDEFLRNGIGGEQNLASLTRIPNAGHLVVQTNPKEFARTLREILVKESSKPQAKL
ncbi:Alpha/beta hydrolase fold-1 [Mycena vulgaris]|nr:Alpha/beta hydrolase fold-1 [Mycena vulgaris]